MYFFESADHPSQDGFFVAHLWVSISLLYGRNLNIVGSSVLGMNGMSLDIK